MAQKTSQTQQNQAIETEIDRQSEESRLLYRRLPDTPTKAEVARVLAEAKDRGWDLVTLHDFAEAVARKANLKFDNKFRKCFGMPSSAEAIADYEQRKARSPKAQQTAAEEIGPDCDLAAQQALTESEQIVKDTIDSALWKIHQDHLLSEGFTESQIYLLVKDYGVRSITESEAIELGFKVADESRKNTKGFVSSSGIYFPFRGDFGQLRCDDPPTRNGKPCKYLTPIGKPSKAFLPPSAKVITEGFKDAAAATLSGVPTGAIAGVSHHRKALPQDSGYTILFDADGWQNPSVFAALISAADWCGGKIQLIPEIEGQPKAGLCEYFKAGYTSEDYQKLIATAYTIPEFLLELPNHWESVPEKHLARLLRTISVLGAKHLNPTELAILENKLKRFGKGHGIPFSEVTRSFKAAKKSTGKAEGKRSTYPVKDSELAQFAVKKWQGDLVYNSEIESWIRYSQVQEGVWSVVSEDEVSSDALELARELAGDFKASLVSGGVKLARIDRQILKPSMPINPDILVFQNGVLKISTQELLPHSREYNATWALQRNYDSNQSNWSPIAEFVSKALWNPQDQDRLVAFHAATIRDLFLKMPGENKKNTLLQIGLSGTGKGTSTRLMEFLVGEPLVKPIESVQALCSKDFILDGIEKESPRLLVVADQEKLPPRLSIGRYLNITGLDSIDVTRKFKRGAKYRHTGGFVINGTEYPWSAHHRGRGATRRSVLIQSWRKDSSLAGIEARFTPEVISAYTNFLLSLPEQWIIQTLENAPGEPTIEAESLDNPMMAWFLDCIEITGDSADRIQIGRDKGQTGQLFGSYFDYCEKANIGSTYSKNHVSFANEFELIYSRIESALKGSDKEFGRVKPGNKLHYVGLRLKLETDDLSRMGRFEALRPEQSEIDSPVQAGLRNQLNPPITVLEELEYEYTIDEAEPDPPDEIEPPPAVADWQPAIGDRVACEYQGKWVKATIDTIPREGRNPTEKAAFYKLRLSNGIETYAWSRDNLRPLNQYSEVSA